MNDLSKLLVVLVAAGSFATGCDNEREVEFSGTLPSGEKYEAEYEVESEIDRMGNEFEVEREVEGEIEVGSAEREFEAEFEIEGEPGDIEGEKFVEAEAEGDGYEWESTTRGELDTVDGQLVYDEVTTTESEGMDDEMAVLGDSDERDSRAEGSDAPMDSHESMDPHEPMMDSHSGKMKSSAAKSSSATASQLSAKERDGEGLGEGTGTGATSEGDAIQASESNLDWDEATSGTDAGSKPSELTSGQDSLVTPDGWQEPDTTDDYAVNDSEDDRAPDFEEPLEYRVLRDGDAAKVAVLGDEEVRGVPEPEPKEPMEKADDGYADSSMDETPIMVGNDTRGGTPIGMGFIVGGGVNDYVGQLDESTDPGGNWEARAIFGTRTVVAGELAYHGTANSLDTLGVQDGAMLVTNGAEGALRVNFLTDRVQPYVLGGVGWKHFNVTNTDTNTSAVRNSDDAMTVPVGAGVAYRINNIHADVRGMYRPAFLADIIDDGIADDTNLDTLSGSVNVGFEF